MNLKKLPKLGILAATLSFAAPIQQAAKPLSACYESADILFVPEVTEGHAPAKLGPWTLGERLPQGKPRDERLNLYVVLPGVQNRSALRSAYDHNLVVNRLATERAREWDIFWCFVMDPALDADLRGEHDLIVAAHETFRPADLFDMEDIPGRETLAEKLGVRTLADLRKYRHKDGTLPRLLIVPAHLAVSATAEIPSSPAAR